MSYFTKVYRSEVKVSKPFFSKDEFNELIMGLSHQLPSEDSRLVIERKTYNTGNLHSELRITDCITHL